MLKPIISSTPCATIFNGLSGSSGLFMYSKAGEYAVFNEDSSTGLKVSNPVVPRASIALF